MLRLLALLSLLSGCITTLPLSSLIEQARSNEAAAVESAVDQRYLLSGTVVDISFERHTGTETTTSGAAIPVGKATIISSTSSTSEVGYARAYADIDTSGTPVRCYFNNGGETERLSKGSTATVMGWFHDLRRKEDALRISLEGCRVEEVSSRQ